MNTLYQHDFEREPSYHSLSLRSVAKHLPAHSNAFGNFLQTLTTIYPRWPLDLSKPAQYPSDGELLPAPGVAYNTKAHQFMVGGAAHEALLLEHVLERLDQAAAFGEGDHSAVGIAFSRDVHHLLHGTRPFDEQELQAVWPHLAGFRRNYHQQYLALHLWENQPMLQEASLDQRQLRVLEDHKLKERVQAHLDHYAEHIALLIERLFGRHHPRAIEFHGGDTGGTSVLHLPRHDLHITAGGMSECASVHAAPRTAYAPPPLRSAVARSGDLRSPRHSSGGDQTFTRNAEPWDLGSLDRSLSGTVVSPYEQKPREFTYEDDDEWTEVKEVKTPVGLRIEGSALPEVSVFDALESNSNVWH